MRSVPAVARASRPGPVSMARGWAGGWVVAEQGPRISILDAALHTLATVVCRGAPTDATVDADGRTLTYATPTGLVRVDARTGQEMWLVAEPTHACREVGGTLVVAMADGHDRIVFGVRDPSTGALLRRIVIGDPFGASAVKCFAHPAPDSVVMWAAAGQDGQATFLVSYRGPDVQATEVGPRDRIPAQFGPSGGDYVVANDEVVERRAWPSGELLGRMPWPVDLAALDDGPLGDVRLLPGHYASWSSTNGRIVIVDLAAMAVVDELTIEGHPIVPIHQLYPSLAPDDSPGTDFMYSEPGPDGLVLTIHRSSELVATRLRDWSPDPSR